VADYTPYAPGINAARSVWDQGIAPLAKRAQAYLKGAAEIPATVAEYVSESTPRSGPMGTPNFLDLALGGLKIGNEAQSVAGEMVKYAVENPGETVMDMAPWVGGGRALMDADNLIMEAQQAEEAGDFEKASTLRQLATVSLASIIPGIPSVKAGIKSSKLTDAEKTAATMKRIKDRIDRQTPGETTVRSDIGEGTRGYAQESPADTAQRLKTRAADIRRQQNLTKKAAGGIVTL